MSLAAPVCKLLVLLLVGDDRALGRRLADAVRDRSHELTRCEAPELNALAPEGTIEPGHPLYGIDLDSPPALARGRAARERGRERQDGGRARRRDREGGCPAPRIPAQALSG